MLSASEVLPMPGRPARITRWPGCRPLITASRSINPVLSPGSCPCSLLCQGIEAGFHGAIDRCESSRRGELAQAQDLTLHAGKRIAGHESAVLTCTERLKARPHQTATQRAFFNDLYIGFDPRQVREINFE